MMAVQRATEDYGLDQIWYDFATPVGRWLINRRRMREGLPRLRRSYTLRDLLRTPPW